MNAHLVMKCVDESSRLFTAVKDGMRGPLSTGDLSLYRAKIYSLHCLANVFFFQDPNLFHRLVKMFLVFYLFHRICPFL